MLNYVIDLLINIILPYGIVISCYFIGFEESIATLLLSLLPITIVTFSYYYNKPKIYIKMLTKFKSKTNVKLTFQHYTVLNLIDNMDFEEFIKNYVEELKKYSNVKITESSYGKLNSRVNLDVDSTRYEFSYDPISSELNFLINTKITFRLFVKEIRNAAKPFDDIARNNHNVTFNKSINSICIEFLKAFEEKDIKNPLFRRIYSDFNIINVILKYKTKRNTVIEFNNDSISFNSKNNILDFVDDVIKQMKLIG
ncbi:hypothetical protein [Clostridium sp.]|uniref:hypothetical protein n=1 Tax=Clostridium sp. TaxID=1506 RepID=UPI002628BA71|nr:hypothetical protein [Clostridium sp.]